MHLHPSAFVAVEVERGRKAGDEIAGEDLFVGIAVVIEWNVPIGFEDPIGIGVVMVEPESDLHLDAIDSELLKSDL